MTLIFFLINLFSLLSSYAIILNHVSNTNLNMNSRNSDRSLQLKKCKNVKTKLILDIIKWFLLNKLYIVIKNYTLTNYFKTNFFLNNYAFNLKRLYAYLYIILYYLS